MRIKSYYLLLLVILVGACKKDNYPAPSCTFNGRIVYNGEAIGVSQQDVYFELWEPGWATKVPINVAVNQDGSFSSLLFPAAYKLVIPASQGPFKSKQDGTTHTDTIQVNITGNQTMDIEVLPYYMIRTPKFTAAGKKITATCKLEQILKGTDARDVEQVVLYLAKTQFADKKNNIRDAVVNGGDITDPNNISLQADVPDIVPAQNYVYARIGVKISGVEDMIFTPVEKVQLQ
ncbi:Protein of unknown function [Chitinophaga terrae (ex Kim and Jung 2007)]|uniref:DUF3823 domain-containing protein n=1 Tax=Chitinophaga terrae (ex Kim and Jung 2007) TaxID=408074 RepID=A0A1H3XCK7_9BACT|nr:DUF3823 domain-containing protein [Chitinophaga terrae (ex Kim and Jung 2007)]MDQ0108924.1 hypothetical protein [Chitinophaga terrae (ex Kim and Jung 2007)]GEP89832.1 hypothetical protein CTE07_14770 [Chitinophaga terrae (ex Kim and Jung 2007)]SDZ96268.1 Protein of unknown function [Chitinophaga terrae (ex Kim and Jung 2007)]